MFHAMAWAVPFCSILSGADLIFPTCHLQAEKLVDILIKEKPNIAYGVPTIWAGIYEELVRNPPNEKLSLKELVCGGSALPKSLIKGFQLNFDVHSLHAWGMTEISPVGTACRLQRIHQNLSEEEQFEILAKQGIELPGIEIKLVTEDGKEAPSR
jgi:fatty-acyl-CoA synthase